MFTLLHLGQGNSKDPYSSSPAKFKDSEPLITLCPKFHPLDLLPPPAQPPLVCKKAIAIAISSSDGEFVKTIYGESSKFAVFTLFKNISGLFSFR